MLSDPPVPSSPYPQFAVPPITPSRSSSLASIPPVILPPRSSSPFSTASHTTTTPQINPSPNPLTRKDGRKIQKPPLAPAALGILKALDPHPDQHIHQPHPHHIHELSDDSLLIEHKDRAEKKEKKSFWDGIIRDKDRDKDRERGRDKERETREHREKDKGREKDREREKDKEQLRERLWREEDPSELTRMIGASFMGIIIPLMHWELISV